MGAVGECPNCGKWIFDTDSSLCPGCGKPLPDEIARLLHGYVRLAEGNPVSVGQTAQGGSHAVSAIVHRYLDAYRVGAALITLGGGIKIVGGVLAVLVALGPILVGNGAFDGAGFVFVGIVIGAMVGVVCWVLGVVVAAQGQILRATLDTAVASSPFMSDAERANAMGLSSAVVGRASN